MNSSNLLSRLDSFYRKYYLNQIIRGILLALAILGTGFLILIFSENWIWFEGRIRTILFFGYLNLLFLVLSWFVVIPFIKLLRFARGLSYEEAALIVGNHFPEIQDKLLNAIQLQKQYSESSENILLLAAIEQKKSSLAIFDFRQAVKLSVNKKYLPYVLPPLSVLIFILLAAPNLIIDPAYRITHFKREFSPPPPFEFIVSENLSTPENENFILNVETRGKSLPLEMYLEMANASYRMENRGVGLFLFEFRNPKENITFKLKSGKYYSQEYTLHIIKKASLVKFKVTASYPSYLSKSSEVFETGDIILPEGTQVAFDLLLKNTEMLTIQTSESSISETFRPQNGHVNFDFRVKKSLNYTFHLTSTDGHQDSVSYSMEVIPDLYPEIFVEERTDSLLGTLRYFRGDLNDDHGLKNLIFKYQIKSENETKPWQNIKLPMSLGTKNFVFTHAMDFSLLTPSPGDEILYSFTVCDNDGVNGSKCTTTPIRVFRVPSLEDQLTKTTEADESVLDNITGSMQQSDKLEKEINNLSRSMLEKKSADWQERKKLEDLLKIEENLRRQIEELKKDMEKSSRLREQLPSDPTLEERKILEKQAEKIMSDELRRLLEEIKKLLEEKQDKSQLRDLLEQAKESATNLDKELERLQELFKKLELESLLNAMADKLEKLAKEERKEVLNNTQLNSTNEKAAEKQEDLNKSFQNLQGEMKTIQEKNNQLEQSIEGLENMEEKGGEIMEEMQKALENLKQNSLQKAAGHQKQAAQEMEEMVKEIRQKLEQEREENQAEDAESIKRLLRSLLTLSFNQEKLMEELKKTSSSSPIFRDHAQKQRRLRDDARIVEDSLFALSKRQIRISDMVNKEIWDIRKNMERSIQRLADRDAQSAGVHQQYVMTGFNNLALMLSESLENMQLQMSQKMKGGGSCSKPGSDNNSEGEMQKIKEMQKKLGEQMRKMAEQMKKEPGGNKPENSGKPGSQGLNSKEIAQMVAQQEILRRKLRELSEKTGGKENKKLLNEIQQLMEQNETDLYNKRLTEQSLLRQRDLMVRLLEFEKALRQQDMEEKRESKSAQDISQPFAPSLKVFELEKQRVTELIQTIPPSLRPYYKEKVNNYINSLK